MTDLQAAIGVAQIKRLDQNVKTKREIANLYNGLLCHPSIQRPIEREWGTNVYWMYGIVLDRPAAPIIRSLREKGIDTRPFFVGLHQQPDIFVVDDNFPVTERLSQNGLYLPSGVTLTHNQIEMVATTLLEML